MAEQGRQKVACTDTKVMMNAIDHELSKIVGLDSLKLELSKFLKGMLMDERRRALGLHLSPRKLPHLAFLGDPGMGKSMVAGMLGKLMHMMGILPKDCVTEVELQDLVRLNQSVWLKIAAGGILLVNDCVATRFEDEDKYWLDYSTLVEKMEKAIIPYMDGGKVVVIIAGFPQELEFLISKYVRLRNRLSNIFHFGYYDSVELAKILHMKVCKEDENSRFRGFKLHPSCTIDALAELILKARSSGCVRENGHLVDETLKEAKENLDSRVGVECANSDSLITFTINDFAIAATL